MNDPEMLYIAKSGVGLAVWTGRIIKQEVTIYYLVKDGEYFEIPAETEQEAIAYWKEHST